jgi:hypothetical protein
LIEDEGVNFVQVEGREEVHLPTWSKIQCQLIAGKIRGPFSTTGLELSTRRLGSDLPYHNPEIWSAIFYGIISNFILLWLDMAQAKA